MHLKSIQGDHLLIKTVGWIKWGKVVYFEVQSEDQLKYQSQHICHSFR